MSHIGSCSCGAVRFAVERYLYLLACHCGACRKRTGSAYGLSVVVEKKNVREFRGTTKTFTRKAESGRNVDYEFCPNCGTTIRWGVATMPERQVFAGGAFAEIEGFIVAGEMYTDRAIPWARLGCELSRSGEADNELRKAMIEKTQSTR